MWVVDKERGLAVSCLPRCGTHSLRQFYNWPAPVNNFDMMRLKLERRIGVIREPLDRFASNFSIFTTNKGSMQDWAYERFVDFCLDENPRHPHWGPQVNSLTLKGEFLPTECIRLESLSLWWYAEYGIPIGILNSVKRKEGSTYRFQDLLNYFEEDIKLYEQLQSLAGQSFKGQGKNGCDRSRLRGEAEVRRSPQCASGHS